MKYVVENRTLNESVLETVYKRFQEQVAKMYTDYYVEQLNNLKNELEQPLENLNFNKKDAQTKISAEKFFKMGNVLPQSATILSGMDELFSTTVGWGELLADTALSILEGVSIQERRQKKLLDQLNPKIEEYMEKLQNYLKINFKETITPIERAVLELELKQIEYISEQH